MMLWQKLLVNDGLSPFSLTDLATDAFDPADTNTYTFTGRNFGDEPTGADVRYIVVMVAGQISGTPDIASVTVGGIPATEVVEATGGGGGQSGIWIANVPTGTSGSVVVSLTGGIGCAISLARMINPSSPTPHATSSDLTPTSGALDLSLNIPTGGAAAASAVSQNASTWTWTGLTEIYEVDINTSEYAGMAMGGSAGTPHTITAINADTTPGAAVGCAASWGP